MRLSTLSMVALLAFAPALTAQAPASTAWCSNTQDTVPVDSLRALALRYHPRAFTPEVRRDSVLVGFVLDASCRVIEHALGRYHAGRHDVATLLQTVIPAAQPGRFILAGIAAATNDRASGTPWIVWVAKRT